MPPEHFAELPGPVLPPLDDEELPTGPPASPLAFWQTLFLAPKTFFAHHFTPEGRANFFAMASVLYGLGYGVDRIDAQLMKSEMRGTLESSMLNEWPGYWITVLFTALFGGWLWYYIAGWFYNVRLKWAGGTSNLSLSRSLYLYSSVVVNTAILGIGLACTFINEKPNDPYADLTAWDTFSTALLLFMSYYSVYVSYRGVTTVTDADPYKARIWFLAIPVIAYSVAYVALIALVAAVLL
ncbi:YIP1 family protein [Rufibacter quisquiliarum]|uniref:Yip1 domain-containing protein n=1 Tax=Rufibacter quisquiliarum TaxID=1549639 RepID=A0A839GP18_9BACT|nr:YIP1 family protein [Rufibacter quisquiliarum]MBA9078539.1 hypothetical protein [Rufibacter quisquiliarum]